MKVRTPNFIISECERLIESLPTEHKKTAEAILEQLHQMNSLENAIQMMESMSELEEKYVYPRMTPQLFKRSHISNTLIKALNHYKKREEAEAMLEFVKEMAKFESSWCQLDECYNWDRTFNVVKPKKEWQRICARAEVISSKGSIKVALEVKRPRKTKSYDKAWQKAYQKLHMYAHAEHDYEIWFRQVDRIIYHIYLP